MSGRRAFTLAVNLRTGQVSQVAMGSWGGPNQFVQRPVDDLDSKIKIPPDNAVIKGSEGHGPTWAMIYVHPETLTPLLPGDGDLSEREKDILGMMRYKSFYKKELFQRNRVTKEEVKKLADGGYIKVNKAGSTSLTTKGKNAGNMNKHF